MYKALYRKYRPLMFSDVVGQEHITTTLQHQVEKGNVSHAYLFTGSRGTGKTTCAKILARAINCLNPSGGNPCGECENCKGILKDSLPDVLEIDAASNNGVDYIRELRERIAFAPAQAKYRVYIIDEVHMLSTAASNALLKTLEEPPKHAVFILATTEINAILPTILSRCQRYDFHRIEPETIAARLEYVAEKEGAVISHDAAMLIASLADGGMRDALSILDLCAATGKEINEEIVNTICGRASTDYLFSLAEHIENNNTAAALEVIARLHQESVDMQRLCLELCEFFRTVSLVLSGIEPERAAGSTAALAEKYKKFSENSSIEAAMRYLRIFNDALSSMNTANRRSAIEMAVIKITTPGLDTSGDALLRRIAQLERKLASGVVTSPPTSVVSSAEPIERVQTEPQPKAAEPKPEPQSEAENLYAEDLTPPADLDTAFAESTPISQKSGETTGKPQGVTEPPQGEGEPLTAWNDIVAACFKTAPMIFSFLTGSTATLQGNKIIIHSKSVQLRNMLAKPESINYKGLCAAIGEVLGGEYYPVMEKEEKSQKNDPMMSFLDRLNNL